MTREDEIKNIFRQGRHTGITYMYVPDSPSLTQIPQLLPQPQIPVVSRDIRDNKKYIFLLKPGGKKSTLVKTILDNFSQKID